MPYEDRFIDNDGVRIHYEVEGEGGPPLVLVHGMGMSTKDWRSAGYTDALSGEFRLILIDSRGFGQSDKLSDPCRLWPQAEGVRRYRRAGRPWDREGVLLGLFDGREHRLGAGDAGP